MSGVKECDCNVGSANVAGDAVGVPEKSTSPLSDPHKLWFVAYVGTCQEKVVRDRLVKGGYDAYAATQWELRVRNSGRRVKIERPVITQYVFVRVTEKERKIIVEYPYIHYFLTDKATEKNEYGRHRLAVIPDSQMQKLKNMLADESAVVHFATTGFSIGDEVQVLGWGDNVKGNIVRIHGDKGRYIGVRISQLGCAYMEIPPSRLIKVPKPKGDSIRRK